MRILINALQAGNRSGTGRYTEELAAHIIGFAPDIEIRVLWPSRVPAPETLPAEVIVKAEGYSPFSRMYRDQFGIRADRKSLGADIVHYPANIGALTPIVPFVLTVHDLSFYRKASWYNANRAVYYWVAARRSIMAARRIIADSKATSDDLQQLLKIPARKIDVVPLGVSGEFQPAAPDVRARIREKYCLPEHFFLYVGTLEPRKNIPAVINAWNRIADKVGCDLVIAGREGWKTRSIHAAARRVKDPRRLHFPGFIDMQDLPALLSAARVFVWPSLCEGFGLPPLEAMACGTPVISSNLSCMPEVLGDAALLVDPYIVEDIADAMQSLASDEILRERYRQKGFGRAARFTWRRTADLTAAAYRKAIQER